MHGVAVTLLSEDKERLSVLQQRLEGTQLGRNVFSHQGLPVSATDAILRQIQDVRTEVVLIDIDPQNIQRAISAIELINASTSDIAIFAVGEMSNPLTIVAAMRAGACEYLEQQCSSEAILEALNRFATSRSKARASSGRARVFTVMNAKGGAGATTVAVNTAVTLQETHGSVLLVDFSPLGHAALHLNMRPTFGLSDALQNLHRMDASLLEGFMVQCKGGLQLLAGSQNPQALAPTAAELARLFDLLVAHFRYVVVDCSNRLDQTARLLCDLSSCTMLVAQADVVSLWSANRIRGFMEEGSGHNRVRLVLNRYKKIPGFTDEDIEKATSCKLLWKLPNNFQSVAPAIDKGSPVAFHEGQELGRSFRSLAAALVEASGGPSSQDLQLDTAGKKQQSPGRLLISPLRAGQ
jgi:Flp pilus assembly CpaE family ATPase